MKENRHEQRSLCADLLKIRWKDESGQIHKDRAILEDISPTGACLLMENPVPPETTLSILYPSGKYQGRVKHCQSHKTGYSIGLDFDPGFRWLKPIFEPSHLLEFPPDADELDKKADQSS